MEILDVICHEGGGASRAINLIWRMILKKKHLESFPDCENVFCI